MALYKIAVKSLANRCFLAKRSYRHIVQDPLMLLKEIRNIKDNKASEDFI